MKKIQKKTNRANISFKRRAAIIIQRLAFIIKLFLVLFLIAFIFFDYFKPYRVLARTEFNCFTANYGFVLKNIIIEGQINTSSKNIIESINASKGDPIFSVKMKEVKERLENIAWIKKAVIERRLPSTIYIALIEREPIAIWQFENKLYLVDSDGNRITKHNGQNFPNLLHVIGQDANIYANSLISDLNLYPKLAAKVKCAVRYGQRRWNLHLEQDIIVKMPENNFSKAYEYLHQLHKDHKLFNQGYKSLDLRDQYKYYLEQK